MRDSNNMFPFIKPIRCSPHAAAHAASTRPAFQCYTRSFILDDGSHINKGDAPPEGTLPEEEEQ